MGRAPLLHGARALGCPAASGSPPTGPPGVMLVLQVFPAQRELLSSSGHPLRGLASGASLPPVRGLVCLRSSLGLDARPCEGRPLAAPPPASALAATSLRRRPAPPPPKAAGGHFQHPVAPSAFGGPPSAFGGGGGARGEPQGPTASRFAGRPRPPATTASPQPPSQPSKSALRAPRPSPWDPPARERCRPASGHRV